MCYAGRRIARGDRVHAAVRQQPRRVRLRVARREIVGLVGETHDGGTRIVHHAHALDALLIHDREEHPRVFHERDQEVEVLLLPAAHRVHHRRLELPPRLNVDVKVGDGVLLVRHWPRRAGHFPVNCAERFSRNARTPSARSALAKQTWKSAVSSLRPSSNGRLSAARVASLAAATATGLLDAIVSASASARSSRAAGSTTSSTRPNRSASSASIRSPVSTSLSAAPNPTMRGSRCVPPPPGMIPRFTSGCPNRAAVLATRKSQASASSMPPPKQ